MSLYGMWRYWYDSSLLNDADLSCKLTTLLALTTVSRASMIQHLNTEFMAKDKDRYIFYFRKLHKSWRKGQALQLLPTLFLVRIRHYV